MWGDFKSYLGQYIPRNEETKDNAEETDEWVFVDMEGNEIKKSRSRSTTPDNASSSSRLQPLPLLDISNTSSPQSSAPPSPRLEEEWLVAPPPCFTAHCPLPIEISPLENLLIEHPSMSVYKRLPELTQNRHSRSSSRQSETSSVSSGASDRGEDAVTRQSRSQTDLKALIDQSENTKPGQQAQWENNQYKLCPSHMNRQNRVHRYQSRKRHNQKKKSLNKPFAEKGGSGRKSY